MFLIFLQKNVFFKAEKIGSEDHRKWLGKDGQHGKSNWWMPIKWSVSIVRKAMKDKRLANAPTYTNLVKSIAAFRKSLTEVVTYGHVTVPLVYTQVFDKSRALKIQHDVV